MSSPVEFRLYATKFTLDDLKAGRQPIRSADGECHNVAVIQFRYKFRLVEAGKGSLEWSPWQDVPFVKEGEEETFKSPNAA